MSTVRQDPITKEWVIFATERAKRPHDFVGRGSPGKAQGSNATCPFCPGNEASTPPEIFVLRKDASSPWSVRVVPNKFAALVPLGTTEHKERRAFTAKGTASAPTKIIETPSASTVTVTINALLLNRVRFGEAVS